MNNDTVIERNAINSSNGATMLFFCTNALQCQRFSHQIPNFQRRRKSSKSFQLMCAKPQDHPHTHPHPHPHPHPHLCLDNRGAAASDPKAAKERSQRPSQADACQQQVNIFIIRTYRAIRPLERWHPFPKSKILSFVANKMQDLSTLAARFMVSWLMV